MYGTRASFKCGRADSREQFEKNLACDRRVGGDGGCKGERRRWQAEISDQTPNPWR